MRTNTNKQAIQKLVGTAMFAALVIILSFISQYLVFGPVSITLSLVPIILGAILFGPVSGGILGGVMGAMVTYSVVTGAAGLLSTMMFQKHPILTVALCFLKTIAAGLLSGWVWKLLQNKCKPLVGTLAAALVCPLCNTAIFCSGLLLFYNDILHSFAEGANFDNVFLFIVVMILGINFVVEVAINLILTPAILRIITAVKKKLN